VVPQIFWSYVPFYKKGTFQSKGRKAPKTMVDFFDVENFPGKRGIHTWANALIEMALVADGVPAKDVYDVMSAEGGIDRAFAKLDTIKDHVVFWSSGSKPLELVESGEVSMALAYNGRIGAAMLSEGADYVVNWDGQVLNEEWLVMLKGSQNYDEALAFLIHASAPEQQAGQARWINYGPMRASGLAIIEAGEPWFNTGVNIMPHMPTTKAGLHNAVFDQPDWWADNGDAIHERYTAWMGQ
jgi:putative spermidine/putrescine transport system substrate-binding protein